MNGPKDVFRRAGTPRRPQIPFSQPTGVAPAVPVMQSPQNVPQHDPTEPQPVQERIVVPQPIRQNSVYHQLMQKHDRMSTRHLKG